MTARDRFELSLPDRLEDLASPRIPSYYAKVIDTTARTRQRPGWSFAERWFPVSAFTDRMVAVPRAPIRAIAVAVLLILALAALVIVAVGSRQSRVPPPFGVADNGRIVWIDSRGAIVAADADGSNLLTLVPGPGNDRPVFSPDGTRLLYRRDGPGGIDLVVTNADGSDPVVVAPDRAPSGAVWGPDSRSVVLSENGTLARVETRAGAEPVLLAEGTDDAFDWNVEPSKLFRPPGGNEIAYIQGGGSAKTIIVAAADGSAPREILSPDSAGFAYTDLGALRWSPDGSTLAFVATLSDDGADTRVFILDAAGGEPRRLRDLEIPGVTVSEGNPQWSPDATRIAIQVWHNQVDTPGVRPLTVVDVASGTGTEIGDVSLNGFKSFAWSPDGASLLTVTDVGTVQVLDAVSGEALSDAWEAASGASWQRIAAP
jgi:WD40 repeat protein